LKFYNNILIIFAKIFAIMPHKIIVNFGKFLGLLFQIIDSKRVAITIENISFAYPNESKRFIIKLKNKAYQNLGIVMAEVMSFLFSDPKKVQDIIILKNPEIIDKVHSRGKGLIILSAHFGNWECFALAGGLFSKQKISLIAKKQSNDFIDKHINIFRVASGNEVLYMDKAAIKVYRKLKNKGIIALMVDQAAPKDTGVFVDFFGRKASTYDAPASLAIKNDVPILIGFAVRDKNYNYNVELKEINYDDIKDKDNAIELLTERHVKILEEEIRKYPHLWAWQHKRWKHKEGDNK